MVVKRTAVCAWCGAGGEVSLQVLRGINRRYGWMAWPGSMPKVTPQPGGMQREVRSGRPCQDWCGTTTHILRFA